MNNIKKCIAEELHKSARRRFPRRIVKTSGIDNLWQADLVDMKKYSKMNKNYSFILTIIDVYTKYGWAIPLKNKSGPTVSVAFQKVFNQRHPKNLQTDRGLEFFNKYMKKVLEPLQINHYSTFTPLKASVVERFNRTIKEKMWKIFTARQSFQWISILSDIIDEYNDRKHSATRMSPNEASESPNSVKFYRLPTYTGYNYGKIKFNVGDNVRISKHKAVFDKGYTQNWSNEIFVVSKVIKTNPVVYELRDQNGTLIKGTFYEQELNKTRYPNTFLVEKILRRNNSGYFVKFLGLNREHNRWIDKNDILL